MEKLTQLDPSLTINEIVALYPATIPVFNRFGLDTCCGGGIPVEAAAHRDDIDVDAVLAALLAVIEPA